jgi:hypothetical protein
MWHNYKLPTILQNGKTIPTICLSSFLAYPLSELKRKIKLSNGHIPPCPEIKRYSNSESLVELLNTAGKERFAAKTALFHKSLKKQEPGQILFRSIARALGYDKNTGPFEELADRLTLSTLEGVKDKPSIVKQALMLGTAGLLPSQSHRIKYRLIKEPEICELETAWQTSDITATMNQADWHFFRVRPDNFPTRRLVALTYLIDRYCQSPGLMKNVLQLGI